MDPQAQRPVSFFAMVTDKRKPAVKNAANSGERSPRRPGDGALAETNFV